MTQDILLEVCIDSVQSAIAAQEGGASRVELCAGLFEGGITPSAGCIAATRKHISIGLMVIIRPRGGDFYYSDTELEWMKKDIQVAKDLGADGVVVGLLTRDGKIDKKRTAELISLAHPLEITFHRAFDMTANPMQALHDLIELGVNRILTSGQEASTYEGAELIGQLVKEAGGKIGIMPGAGINERNIHKIRQITGAKEFHVSGRKTVPSQMHYRNEHVYMGGALRLPEFQNSFTDAARIHAILNAM